MTQKKFTIYCHTNKVNGKPYVGQTVDSMDGRWREHLSAAKRGRGSRIFGHAIRKYGPDAFSHEILEVVETQQEADAAEVKWVVLKRSRAPHGYNLASGGNGPGYHHDESKQMIGAAAKRRIREMTPEQRAVYFATNIHVWTDERREAHRARLQAPEMREKVADGQKEFWSGFTAEEKSARVKHQLAGMSAEQKADRTRKAWGKLTPEARAERVQRAQAGISDEASTARAAKMSAWQTEQAKLRTPEQRSAIGKKAAATRLARYGKGGVKHKTTRAEFGEISRGGWKALTPEARAERVRRSQEGIRRSSLKKFAESHRLDEELVVFVRHWIVRGHSVESVASAFNVSSTEIERAVA